MSTQLPIRRIIPRGIRPQLVGLVALATLTTGALLGVSLIESSQAALRQEVLVGNLASVDLAVQFAAEYVGNAQLAARDLAARPVVVQAVTAGEGESLMPALATFGSSHRRFDTVSVLDSRGVTLASTTPTFGPGPDADVDWVLQVLTAGHPDLGLPQWSASTQKPVLPYGVPVRDASGEVRGLVVGEISVLALSDAISRIKFARGARGGIIDFRHDGVILVHADPSRILTPVSTRNEAVMRVAGGQRGVLETESSFNEPVLTAFSPVPDLPWGILVAQPSAVAFEPTQDITRGAIGLITLAVIVVTFLATVLAFRFTRPLARLREAANAIATGDLNRRVGLARSDEIGDLSNAFDRMAVALSERNQALSEAMEAQEAAIKELEAFSYSVSHDLRAPLRVMEAYSRALIEDHGHELSPEARHQVDLVFESSVEMGALITDLLQFSRLGREPLVRRWVNPRDIAGAALSDLEGGSHAKVFIGDLPPCQADPVLLRQVFANLLSNALKFSRKRDAPSVEVNWMGGDETTYFVRDNGVGFDMKQAGTLFDVFQRLHPHDEFEGTGVGLAIVQRIVHRHGGRVWADSATDRGATFFFTLGEAGPGSMLDVA